MSPPAEGLDARAELVEGKRLDQVVIGPHLEALHPVLHAVPGRQDQDAGGTTPGPELSQDLQARHAGQHQVQHDDVVLVRLREREALLAVTGEIDGVAEFL